MSCDDSMRRKYRRSWKWSGLSSDCHHRKADRKKEEDLVMLDLVNDRFRTALHY